MTPKELASQLRGGALRPAYLVTGGEALLRDEAVALLRDAVVPAASADFNLDRLDGTRTAPGALLDAVRTLPVMADHRLVLLVEPETQRGAGLADAIAEAVGEVEGAAPEPATAGPTVLVVVAAKTDGRARWVRAFPGEAVVHCDPPKSARDLAAFVRAEARRQGVTLEREAVELLAERVGPQLLLLRNEIAKAALLAGPGVGVTRSHVEHGTGDVAEEPIWDLTDAIGEGRSAEALRVLHKLGVGGAPAPVVLGSLAAHFRKLARVRSGGRVAGPPFVVRKLEGQAARYTPGRLVACLRAIHETDAALKGQGALGPELALERLVIGLSG